MDYKEQLNRYLLTKQEQKNKQKEQLKNTAEIIHDSIKSIILDKAKNGKYEEIFGKKRISIDYNIGFPIRKYVKQICSPPTKVGIFGNKYKYTNDQRYVVNPEYYDEYYDLMKLIYNLCEKDNIEVIPIIRDDYTKMEYSFPSPVLGVNISHCHFTLKCSIYF